MQEKGAFIVSLWTCQREDSFVSDAIRDSWDPIWIYVNQNFENEVASRPELHILSERMFFVWEGNHRTIAWHAAIKEKFSMVKEKHCRVLCTVIDPTKVPEIALLASLQRMNFMNTHALVTSHLRDELVNCSHICAADHEEYLKGLSEKDRSIITLVRKRYSKGAKPWYPLTRRYLGKLLYDVQISKEIHSRMDQARQRLSADDLVKEEEKVINDIALKYGDRVGKVCVSVFH
ncbi:hypothetical protein GOP47_0005826 [Adiantum capillus-veneris]|uniref:Uncharacterized protein n=1 Tax=Adiantum capillus-veneris TaxID=13818 RepID=A0A9D4ZNM5_ADICA|nr:hypothetical protein GOP47_0005826 [Adiantum capillus-veneris]